MSCHGREGGREGETEGGVQEDKEVGRERYREVKGGKVTRIGKWEWWITWKDGFREAGKEIGR